MAEQTDPDIHPSIAIAWDPAVVDPADYAEVVRLLGAIAQQEGAAGIQRVGSAIVELRGGSSGR